MNYNYTKKPWEVNPLLAEDFLQKISLLFKKTQEECLEERFNMDVGDSHYSFGHTVRAWRIKRLKDLIYKNKGILKILKDKGNRFEFAIGDTILKIYSGSPDSLTKNIWKKTDTEAHKQLQLNLFEASGKPLVWRFLIESTPITHEYLCTYIIGFNEIGDKVCLYRIIDNGVPVMYDVTAQNKEPVILQKAKFSKKNENKIIEIA